VKVSLARQAPHISIRLFLIWAALTRYRQISVTNLLTEISELVVKANMNKVLFPHITRWLLLLIPITFLGFYPSYFSRQPGEVHAVYHIHAFFMLLWVALAIVQPYLIKRKNTTLHRRIGRISYLLMPFVFVTAFLVIRHAYKLVIANETANVTSGAPTLSLDQIRAKAAANMRLGIIYLIWLATFYILAIVNRKKIIFHATYMFAAILTILGPTLDRLIGHSLSSLGLPYNLVAENFVFISILLVLSGLIYHQWRKGNTVKPASVSLGIYCVGLVIFYTLPDTVIWRSFIELIM
jgi:hypothetical protein